MLKEQIRPKTIEERFIIRPPQMSDLADVLELLEICDLTMIGEVEASAEMLKTDWTNPLVELERNFILITTKNGRVVGFGELWDDNRPLVGTWHWARVHPDFEGQGIGTYLNNWATQLSLESMAIAPEDARFTIETGTPSTYRPAAELLTNQGMTLKRHFYDMQINLNGNIPSPNLPENITIRPMRGLEEMPVIVHAVDDAFQDHWGYVQQEFDNELAFLTHIAETDPSFDPDLWFLAVDGEQIAGLSLCWPKHGNNHQMGWVGTLGVLRPWRRQGIGLALLHHSFGELQKLGKNKAGLGVDAGSLTGATRLYKKAGMHVARQFDVYEKELRPGIDLVKRSLEE